MQSISGSRSASPGSSSPLSTAPTTPPELGVSRSPSTEPSKRSKDTYWRWRPSYHLMPTTGWMNDPCAPGYDSRSGNYIVSFQWNPNGPDWGDICWGTAISKDMVTWEVLATPTLRPDTEYDGQGVFTGCMIPGSADVNDTLAVAYTSVNQLPIHHTLPHVRGSESLALATSQDGGRTWTKTAANPILPCDPKDLEVTGWRDPFVAPWPSMARKLSMPQDTTLFGLISGGVRDVTPTTFLYAISASDFSQWTYLGPLVDVGLNKRLSRWSGDLGRNWEVTNFVTFNDDEVPSQTRDFLVMGTEGCLAAGEDNAVPSRPERPKRGQLWMSGPLRGTLSGTNPASQPSIQMDYTYGGHLDHGCLYAANSFYDPVSDKQVVWGWITEEDLCDSYRHKQGWSGLLSLPRELRLQTLRHVIGTVASCLTDMTNIECELDEFGSYTVRTLGSTVLESVRDRLRRQSGVKSSYHGAGSLLRSTFLHAFSSGEIQTSRWELQCALEVSKACRSIGLCIDHSSDPSSSTTLMFEPKTETFTITRPQSFRTESPWAINHSPEVAPHTLFVTRAPQSGLEETEPLEISVWRDNSVLEVFVNQRTVISTRLYIDDETCGIRFFADDGEDPVQSSLLCASLWDGLGGTDVLCRDIVG